MFAFKALEKEQLVSTFNRQLNDHKKHDMNRNLCSSDGSETAFTRVRVHPTLIGRQLLSKHRFISGKTDVLLVAQRVATTDII